jgi:hypothetical protein
LHQQRALLDRHEDVTIVKCNESIPNELGWMRSGTCRAEKTKESDVNNLSIYRGITRN